VQAQQDGDTRAAHEVELGEIEQDPPWRGTTEAVPQVVVEPRRSREVEVARDVHHEILRVPVGERDSQRIGEVTVQRIAVRRRTHHGRCPP
jgi:hypothetical protein